MVALYIGGKKVDWADAAGRLADPATERERIELRDEGGNVVRRLHSAAPAAQIEIHDDDPDWVKAITPQAIEDALAGPFMTLEEFRKQEGLK